MTRKAGLVFSCQESYLSNILHILFQIVKIFYQKRCTNSIDTLYLYIYDTMYQRGKLSHGKLPAMLDRSRNAWTCRQVDKVVSYRQTFDQLNYTENFHEASKERCRAKL